MMNENASDILPLSGTTVVDLTQVLAGPFATMILGDLGADVIKIEAVDRGDRSRGFTPQPEYFDSVNRNKLSVGLDLKTERGQEVARTLLKDADVFIESTKPGRIQDFGLSYPEIREFNPEIIYCSISGFGSDSPYQNTPAWDMLIQAMSGIMSMTGTPDTPPLWSGLPSGDLAASMYSAQSILAALYARDTGEIEGEWIEVPMLDAAISWLSLRAGYTFGLDKPFPRLGTHHPSAAPFGVFEAENGLLVIAAGTESLWQNLCRAIDRTDLLNDDRFGSMEDRGRHIEELKQELERTLKSKPVEEWVGLMHEYEIPAGPIQDTQTVWEDKHVQQRGLRVTMERPERTNAKVIDHPVHFTRLSTSLRTPPQELGESTTAVLKSHGYSEEEIKQLRETDTIN